MGKPKLTPAMLREERMCRRLSCAAIGHAIGLTESHVFRMEKEQLPISEHVADKIIQLFEMTAIDPMFGICVVCGKHYEPVRVVSRHCGRKECAKKAHLITQNQNASQISHICIVCGARFTRAHGSGRRTCGRKCASAAMGKTRSMRPVDFEPFRVNFYDMETGCSEYRSWDCPEMDPFTNRMEPVLRFNPGEATQ